MFQNRFRDLFAMVRGVAEEKLADRDALEVKVEIVLPGEPDAAMDLHAAVADFAALVGAVSLCDGDCPGRIRRGGGQGPGREGRCGAGAFGEEEHVGALMLHRLETADDLSKLLRVLAYSTVASRPTASRPPFRHKSQSWRLGLRIPARRQPASPMARICASATENVF